MTSLILVNKLINGVSKQKNISGTNKLKLNFKNHNNKNKNSIYNIRKNIIQQKNNVKYYSTQASSAAVIEKAVELQYTAVLTDEQIKTKKTHYLLNPFDDPEFKRQERKKRKLLANQEKKEISNSVEEEKNKLHENLPTYTIDEIQRLKTDYMARGNKLDSADKIRKLYYNAIGRGEIDDALQYFKDLQQLTSPSMFDFNLIFVHCRITEKYNDIKMLYDSFKQTKLTPNLFAMGVLFKCVAETGSVLRILELYERMFTLGYIPDKAHLEPMIKCASLGGHPATLFRFHARLLYKGYELGTETFINLIKVYGTRRTNELTKKHFGRNEFAMAMKLALKAFNYKVAIGIIAECRDQWDMQPHSMMYETLLDGCIRDGYLRERAREWKKKLKKYSRDIERREDHFEFADFIRDLEKEITERYKKDLTYARPDKPYPAIHMHRTSRVQSARLYKHFPKVRYESMWEDMEKFDWVPSYKLRKEKIPLLLEQQKRAAELQELQDAAHQELIQQKEKQTQQ